MPNQIRVFICDARDAADIKATEMRTDAFNIVSIFGADDIRVRLVREGEADTTPGNLGNGERFVVYALKLSD